LERVAESQSPVQYFKSAAEKNNKAGLLDFKVLKRVVQEMTFKLVNYACALIRTEWCLSRIMQMKIMCSWVTVFLYLEDFRISVSIAHFKYVARKGCQEDQINKSRLQNRFENDLLS